MTAGVPEPPRGSPRSRWSLHSFMPWRYTGRVNSRDRPAANWYEWMWVSHWCSSLRSKNSEIIVGGNANVAFHQCWLDHFCKMNRSCWLIETCNLKRKMWLVTWQLEGQIANLRVFFCETLLKNTFKMISVGTNYFHRKKKVNETFWTCNGCCESKTVS